MSPVSLACPYCNSLVVLPRLPDAEQRIRCPRCQELFPYHGETGAAAAGDFQSTQAPAEGMLAGANGNAAPPSRRVSNQALARIVVAVMGLMAVAALLFAWVTKDQRRRRDSNGEPLAVPVVAPARLAGLGYLPSNVNLIAGIHVGELWDKMRTTRVLLAILEGQAQTRLADLERSTALKIADIDHIVIGVRLAIPPPVTIVVRTRDPYDKWEVLRALDARREKGEKVDRPGVYPFLLKERPIDASVWCADDCTLVFTIFNDDMKSVPAKPNPTTGRFAPALETLAERLTAGTQVWSIGEAANLPALSLMLQLLPPAQPLLSKLPGEDPTPLAEVRSLGAWMQFVDETVSYRVEAECKDASAAEKVNAWLAQKGIDKKKPLPFLEGISRAEPLAKELAAELNREQKAERVTLDARSSFVSLRGAVFVKHTLISIGTKGPAAPK